MLCCVVLYVRRWSLESLGFCLSAHARSCLTVAAVKRSFVLFSSGVLLDVRKLKICSMAQLREKLNTPARRGVVVNNPGNNSFCGQRTRFCWGESGKVNPEFEKFQNLGGRFLLRNMQVALRCLQPLYFFSVFQIHYLEFSSLYKRMSLFIHPFIHPSSHPVISV